MGVGLKRGEEAPLYFLLYLSPTHALAHRRHLFFFLPITHNWCQQYSNIIYGKVRTMSLTRTPCRTKRLSSDCKPYYPIFAMRLVYSKIISYACKSTLLTVSPLRNCYQPSSEYIRSGYQVKFNYQKQLGAINIKSYHILGFATRCNRNQRDILSHTILFIKLIKDDQPKQRFLHSHENDDDHVDGDAELVTAFSV